MLVNVLNEIFLSIYLYICLSLPLFSVWVFHEIPVRMLPAEVSVQWCLTGSVRTCSFCTDVYCGCSSQKEPQLEYVYRILIQYHDVRDEGRDSEVRGNGSPILCLVPPDVRVDSEPRLVYIVSDILHYIVMPPGVAPLVIIQWGRMVRPKCDIITKG